MLTYRIITDTEFWNSCERAIGECRDAGYDEPLDVLQEKFMKVYLSLHPALGCCIA